MKTVSVPWSNEHYHLRDGKVRWRGYEVKGADPLTFEPLNHIWARDAKRVYTQPSVNKLADRATFEVLNCIFAKDKSRVFYLSGWVKEADAASFRVLDQGRILGSGLCEKNSDQDWAYSYNVISLDRTERMFSSTAKKLPVWTRRPSRLLARATSATSSKSLTTGAQQRTPSLPCG